jgi:alpha-glucosidase
VIVRRRTHPLFCRFLGEIVDWEPAPGGVAIRAHGGAVRVELIRGVGTRLRYSFDGSFSEPHSAALAPDAAEPGAGEIEERKDAVVVSGESLQVLVSKRPLRVSVLDDRGRPLLVETAGAGLRRQGPVHLVASPAATRYFGLGQQSSLRLERSGVRYTLWNTDRFAYASRARPLYTSFPFYLAVGDGVTRGVFYDNPWRSRFDFAAGLRDQVGWLAAGGEVRCYVLPGPSPREVLERYTLLTGRSPLPPLWALGYHQSRWSYHPAAEVERLAAEFRERRIPCDGLWLDIAHMDGYRVFTWDPQGFPDPAALLAGLARRGFKAVTIVDPGVKVDQGYRVYREGVARQAFARNGRGGIYVGRVWPGRAVFPDFSCPETRRWWGDLHRELLDAGVRGIWNDMNEPCVFGPRRTMPNSVRFDNEGRGGAHAELHNQYGLLMARATHEGLLRLRPDRRPFILTRAAFSGVHRYAAVWTGDNVATWTHLRLVTPMVLGLGLAGVPFAGADIGGFMGSPSGELFLRFLQLGAFLPFFRTHAWLKARRREPWSFGPEIEAAARRVIELRYRLLPYLYTAFHQNERDGRPVVRPLWWDGDHDPRAFAADDQFVLGDHLLVAPVVRRGARSRTLYLPRGEWRRFVTGERYEGGRAITVPAPLAEIPLFVRAGAVLPMREVQQYADERPLARLDLELYPGEAVSECYEDDGEGFGYRRGRYRLTRFTTRGSEGEQTVEIEREGTYEAAAALRLRVRAPGATGTSDVADSEIIVRIPTPES